MQWTSMLTRNLSSDPGAPDATSAKGMISLSFGKLFEKVGGLFIKINIAS